MTTREVSSQLSKTETHIVPNTGPIKDSHETHSPQSLISRHRALSVTEPVDPKALVEAQQEAANKATLDPRTVISNSKIATLDESVTHILQDRIHAGARTPGSLAAEMEGHQNNKPPSTNKNSTKTPSLS